MGMWKRKRWGTGEGVGEIEKKEKRGKKKWRRKAGVVVRERVWWQCGWLEIEENRRGGKGGGGGGRELVVGKEDFERN